MWTDPHLLLVRCDETSGAAVVFINGVVLDVNAAFAGDPIRTADKALASELRCHSRTDAGKVMDVRVVHKRLLDATQGKRRQGCSILLLWMYLRFALRGKAPSGSQQFPPSIAGPRTVLHISADSDNVVLASLSLAEGVYGDGNAVFVKIRGTFGM